MKTKKYNTYDEHGRLIDENISLKRATATVRENPGSTKRVIKTGLWRGTKGEL